MSKISMFQEDNFKSCHSDQYLADIQIATATNIATETRAQMAPLVATPE
jgi:hypothetical protein